MSPPGGRAGRGWGGRGVAVLVLGLATACPPGVLTSQVPADTAPAAPTAPAADSARPVGPFGALWRSMLLPGWGQAATGRHTVGALFVAWEGVTIMMTVKASREADYFREIGSPLLDSKKQEVEDWLVLWVFNHLFAGAEAFVSAHLRDFPPDLRLRAVPNGIAVSLPLPRP
ncbi:MAG TPA: hypothetical protein VNI61_01645 [Gemmatimonadales bacterium]|nr:hypothetical protein [Gemmatimonadales bacterium]